MSDEPTLEGVSSGTEKEISELTARPHSNEHEKIIEFQTSTANSLI